MNIPFEQDNSRERDIMKVELYFCQYGLYRLVTYLATL